MSTIQATFNAVIDAGLYDPRNITLENSEFMCFSLVRAREGKVITPTQAKEAQQAIQEYIGELTGEEYASNALQEVLEEAHLPSTAAYRMAIYLDWANRPYP